MFDVGEYRFKAYDQPCVLRMSPYIRTNPDDENSAHAMLLLYVPWPLEGENNLLRGSETAVEAFAVLKKSEQLPLQLLKQIVTLQRTEELLNDTGEVVYTQRCENDHGENNHEIEVNSECDSIMDVEVDDETCTTSFDNTLCPIGSTLESSSSSFINNSDSVQVISEHQAGYYTHFVPNRTAEYMNKYAEENSSTSTSNTSNTASSSDDSNSNPTRKIPLPRQAEREEELKARRERMTPDQGDAYDTIAEYIVRPLSIIQFVTGGAGVGKSEYIKCIIEMTRLYFGKCPGMYGSVLIMGPTGCAAHHIDGFTWQSVCMKTKKERRLKGHARYLSQNKAETLYDRIKGVKLIVIDEISMVSLEALYEISKRISEAICTSIADPKERAVVSKKPFGGITTIFCGDLYQLPCVRATSVYSTGKLNARATEGQKIWRQIGLYHNFTTSTRFHRTTSEDASPIETFLNGARVGKPLNRYLNMLNTQLCINYLDAYNKCDKKAIWLCSTHEEKEPINKFMYERLKADGAYTMDVVAQHSRDDCPDAHMTKKERELCQAKKVDGVPPVLLRLAIGSRVKIIKNIGTQIGKYIFFVIVVTIR